MVFFGPVFLSDFLCLILRELRVSVRSYLNEIDAIFISHGTLRHAGGLPLLHRRNKQILSSSSHLLKRKKIGERKDGSSGGTQRERTCVSSGLPGDASSSQKARQSRGREEEAEEDGAKSFDGEDRDRLCCCFTKRCLDCSVPAYITQPAQRLGLVALDGAVRSRGGGVCTPLSQDGGWINSPDWTVDDGQTNADGAGEEREHKEDRNDLTESAGDDDALRGERIVVRKLEGCEATLGGFVTVSLADVHDVMQACRTLRYDERICLSPRKRKRGKRRGETRQRGRGVEGCEGERPRRVEEENGDGKARDRVEVTEEEHGAIERKRRRAQPVGDRFQGVSEGEGSESDDDEDDVEVYVHCVRAGHTIGGAVWLFDAGGRKIIFGVDHCLSPLWYVFFSLFCPSLFRHSCRYASGISGYLCVPPCESEGRSDFQPSARIRWLPMLAASAPRTSAALPLSTRLSLLGMPTYIQQVHLLEWSSP